VISSFPATSSDRVTDLRPILYSARDSTLPDPKNIYSRMIAGLNNAIVQTECCSALATYFSSAQASDMATHMPDLPPIIDAILDALQLHGHSENWSMTYDACQTLNTIVQRFPSPNLFLQFVPSLKTIVTVMEEFSKGLYIQWSTCALLYRLTHRNSEFQAKLIELRLAERVVEILNNFFGDVEVLVNACGLFDNLSIRYDLMDESTVSNAIEILFKVLHHYHQNTTLLATVLAGLGNLARYSPDSQNTLASKGILPLLLDIIKKYTVTISSEDSSFIIARNGLRCVINVIQDNTATTEVACGKDIPLMHTHFIYSF
jgi:hypothetical protein